MEIAIIVSALAAMGYYLNKEGKVSRNTNNKTSSYYGFLFYSPWYMTFKNGLKKGVSYKVWPGPGPGPGKPVPGLGRAGALEQPIPSAFWSPSPGGVYFCHS